METEKETGWHIGLSQDGPRTGLHARRWFTRRDGKTVLWKTEASGAEIASALRELADYVEHGE